MADSTDLLAQLRAQVREEILAELEAESVPAQLKALRDEVAELRKALPYPVPYVPYVGYPWWYYPHPVIGQPISNPTVTITTNTFTSNPYNGSIGLVRGDDPGAGSLALIS